MMYGAATLLDLVGSPSCRMTQGASLLQRRTIAANWLALSYRHSPAVAVHVPASLPAATVQPVRYTESEEIAREWIAREEVKAAMVRRGRKPLLRHGANGASKLPTMSVPASQLWPAEVRLARGYGLIDPSKAGLREIKRDWTQATIEQIAASYKRD